MILWWQRMMWMRLPILLFHFFLLSSVVSSLITSKNHHLHQRQWQVSYPSPSQVHGINAGNLETLSAAVAVGCSSLLGMRVNSMNIPKFGKIEGIGLIVAIITASHFSGLGISPSSHRFYDICWKCLPASLSLLLLSPIAEDKDTLQKADILSRIKATNNNKVKVLSKMRKSRVRDAARKEIIAVSIPFIFGCIGSILGCLLSYLICWLGKNNQFRFHTHILVGRKHYFFQPGKLLYEPSEAAVAAGCVISSYIGGSLNYLASAKVLQEGSAKVAATGVLSGTLGSVASDMLVMPMYLSALALTTSSEQLRKWFPGRVMSNETAAKKELSSELNKDDKEQANAVKRPALHASHILMAAVLVPLVTMIVAISDAFEAKLQVQGTGLLCTCLISSFIASTTQPLLAKFPRILSDISQVTLKLSNVCYFILISVIGIPLNLRRLTLECGWSSASSVIFSSIPLLVHLIAIVTGSLAMMKLFPQFKLFPLSVEEVVIASSTAVCGPVAAAALVAKMMASRNSKIFNKTEWKGLAIAGTFWGIVGYAFGSIIGVSISRALLSTIL